MRKLPYWSIAAFAITGLVLGVITGKINKEINVAVHKKFKDDNPIVTGLSLAIQFFVIIGILFLAATYMPWITPDDLGGGVASFAMGNLYFTCQFHFVQELSKFVDGRFDGLERYT
jgi:H+/Cl- antiporter ClcA